MNARRSLPTLVSDGQLERQREGVAALVSLALSAAPTQTIPAVSRDPVVAPWRDEVTAPAFVPQRKNWLARLPWPLLLILAAQAALSLRLVWTNTAFQDEALYLWAGHLEIAHWLHGVPIPAFSTYFSGAPVIYPPIGAVADSIGGLAVARLLSLCFMLGATALLWAATARLYERRAAFFASGLWAMLGPTLHVGAFATYDAMSICLIALAAWCVLRAPGRGDGTAWMLAAAGSVTLANATAYSSAIFDPVVIVMALLTAFPQLGGKGAAMRGTSLLCYTATVLVLLVTAGGGYYMAGISQTVLARTPGTDPTWKVLSASWAWTAPVLVAAATGLLVCAARERASHRRLMLFVLAVAGILVPLDQARIHTFTSLDKHTDVGAWFAAIAAGYTVDTAITFLRPRALRMAASGAGALALAIPAQIGMAQAQQLYGWANAASFVTTLRPLVSRSSGHLLVENPSFGEYYSTAGTRWQHWSSTRSIVLPSGRSISAPVGKAGDPLMYRRLIARGYFSLVALNFDATPSLDRQIAADLGRNSSYQIIATIPYGRRTYVIWQHDGARSNA